MITSSPEVGSIVKEEDTVDAELSTDKVNIILKRHVHMQTQEHEQPPPCICISLEQIKRGVNHQTFIVKTSLTSYILRLSDGTWPRRKTEGEVAAITLLRIKCPNIPIPRIYGYCSDRNLSGIGHEYILMEYLMGVPLDEIFDKMSFEEKKTILEQIVRILADMKSIKFTQIGSFVFDPKILSSFGISDELKIEEIQLTDIKIGPVLSYEAVGPCDNWTSYFNDICKAELAQLKTSTSEFAKLQCQNTKRIEAFLNHIISANSPLQNQEEIFSPEVVFTHGDFDTRNIIVTGTKITGLIDLEFAGAFPVDNEWFDGFTAIGCDTPEWLALGESESTPETGDPKSNPELLKPIHDFFLTECFKLGVKIRSQIPGHYERAELYYFMCNIFLFYFRNFSDNDISEVSSVEKKDALKRIDFVLSKFGF